MPDLSFADYPLIQSVVPMVHKKANAVYNRVSQSDRGWIDPEDVLQEGLIAAFLAQQPGAWKPDGGAKFSTYAWRGINQRLHRKFSGYLDTQSRTAEGVIEIDKIDSDTGISIDLPDPDAITDSSVSECDFVMLCSRLSGRAATLLIRELIVSERPFCQHHISVQNSLTEIRKVISELGLAYSDLYALVSNRESKISVLKKLSTDGNIEVSTMEAKLLQCIECDLRFSLKDLQAGKYIAETSTCMKCYEKLAALPVTVSCFGREKREYVGSDGVKKVIEGYSAADTECTVHCQDRTVCKNFIKKEIKAVSEEEFEEIEVEDDGGYGDDLDIDAIADEVAGEVEQPKAAKKDKVKAKPEAKKTAKKVAKPVKAVAPAKKVEAKAEPKKAAKKVELVKKEKAKEPVAAKKAKKVEPITTKSKKAVEPAAKSGKVAPIAKKAAKPAKTSPTRAIKGDPDVVPEKYKDQLGARYPHKAGSMMRAAFMYCLKGIKTAELKKKVEEIEHDWNLVYRVLLRNESATHYWQLLDDGGFLRLMDVRPKTAKEADAYRTKHRGASKAA